MKVVDLTTSTTAEGHNVVDSMEDGNRSFEIFQKAILAEEEFQKDNGSPFSDAVEGAFPSDFQGDDSFDKHGVTVTSTTKSSPTKVMDFDDDGFYDDGFYDDDDEDDDNPFQQEGNDGSKPDWQGFPISPSSHRESIEGRNKQQKIVSSNRHEKDVISAAADQQSITSRSTNWQTSSSGQDTDSQANSHPIKQTGANQDDEHNNNNKEELSHWEHLKAKFQMGTSVKANILQVRRRIMECHEPNPQFSSDDDNDVSVLGTPSVFNEPPSFEFTEKIFNESMFSYKSWQNTSQEAMSLPSDAPTPIRRQTKTKTAPSSSSTSMKGKYQQNDPAKYDSSLKLCIDHYGQSDFETLMSNLKDNGGVTELHVFRSWDDNAERSRTTEDIGLLFQTIRSLLNLEILNLANFLVQEIHFVALSQWQNENLHTVRIHVCKGAISKRLLSILAGLPALRELTLEMNQSFPFHILLSSRTLESLSIVASDFNVDNLHAMEMVQRLPKNQTLKKLAIEPPIRLRTFKFLAAALSKNISIEHFQFSLLPGKHADTNSAICELARTLTAHASLKTVWNLNYSNTKVKERTSDMVMKALTENFIIEKFVVFDEAPWFRNKKDRILKENKGDTDIILPHIFHCAQEDGNRPCLDRGDNGETVAVAGEGLHTIGNGLVAIGHNVKSHAKNAVSGVSGAFDFVGQTVGL